MTGLQGGGRGLANLIQNRHSLLFVSYYSGNVWTVQLKSVEHTSYVADRKSLVLNRMIKLLFQVVFHQHFIQSYTGEGVDDIYKFTSEGPYDNTSTSKPCPPPLLLTLPGLANLIQNRHSLLFVSYYSGNVWTVQLNSVEHTSYVADRKSLVLNRMIKCFSSGDFPTGYLFNFLLMKGCFEY